jgi:hypothetical protein
MTNEEALAEAIRRWGDHGHVMVERDGYGLRYSVGSTNWWSPSRGASWEEAFIAANLVEVKEVVES